MDCVSRQSFSASFRWLEKHERLHLQHGPIDLILQVDGEESERKLAFAQAMCFFETVLTDLVSELGQLRKPVSQLNDALFRTVVAQHMMCSVSRFIGPFVTPMAAVAGSVADCTLAALCDGRQLDRAFINNGGDIALYLNEGQRYRVGICESPLKNIQAAHANIDHSSGVRGIATSGWHGRSHSLGIADAVTVLASNAALADTAATLIANQIDLPGSPKIKRNAAIDLSPDSDLGSRLVTVNVSTLSSTEVQLALLKGQQYAHALINQGLIDSAYMSLQGQRLVAGQDNLILWRQSA